MKKVNLKREILEKAIDKYDDLSPSALTQYIKEELESYNLEINNEEEENIVTEIRLKVEDEVRAFPSRERK